MTDDEIQQNAKRYLCLKNRRYRTPVPSDFVRDDGSYMQTVDEALDWLIAAKERGERVDA